MLKSGVSPIYKRGFTFKNKWNQIIKFTQTVEKQQFIHNKQRLNTF